MRIVKDDRGLEWLCELETCPFECEDCFSCKHCLDGTIYVMMDGIEDT